MFGKVSLWILLLSILVGSNLLCNGFTSISPRYRYGKTNNVNVPVVKSYAFASAAKLDPRHRSHAKKGLSRLLSGTNGAADDKNENEQKSSEVDTDTSASKLDETTLQEKASAFLEMALPYFKESTSGKWLFAGMIAMTLLNSGVSVAFSYVGKDFWNALNSKDTEQFYIMLWRYAGALLVGSPVSVLYTFQRERLA